MPLFHPFFKHRSLGFVASLVFLLLIFSSVSSPAQTCDPPKIVANSNKGNLFTPEQEMVLGELTLQRFSGEFRLIRDPALQSYVDSIGQRLIKHLPDSGIKFTFHLVDFPEANAFNIPGGHVFLSRKLIAFANSEDELAFVIGHELGHGVVRHGTIDLSLAMSEILNVKHIGTRQDIADKYNQLIEKSRTKSVRTRRGHEGDQQLEADQIGFFAAVAAGYDPDAAFTFYDRLTESEGKTGSWFSDLFGSTRPAQKRLRETAQATSKLPASCREGRDAKVTASFMKWQANVVAARNNVRETNLPGMLWKRDLGSKLRSDVKRLEFSSDGKYLFAIDDTSVTVIKREGAKVLLNVPVDNVRQAHFASNNTELVFLTGDLRFERWNLERLEPISIRELVVRDGCIDNSLSPDGNYFACVDVAGTVSIIDTRTGERRFKKEKYHLLGRFASVLSMVASGSAQGDLSAAVFQIQFSPDSRYVLIGRSTFSSVGFFVTIYSSTGSSIGGAFSNNSGYAPQPFAVDLSSMNEFDLKGEIKKVAGRPYAFLGPDKILGSTEPKHESGGVFSFPDGKRLTELTFGGREIIPTGDPNFVVIKPLANAKMGIFDIRGNSVAAGMHKDDVAIWGDTMAFESVSGKILFRKFSDEEIKKKVDGAEIAVVDLPSSPLATLQGSTVSNDLKWLMISTRSRGGIWDLQSGQRKVVTRGFWGGILDTQGNGVAQFDRAGDEKAVQSLISAANGSSTTIRELPEVGIRQYGKFILTRSKTKTDPEANRDVTQEQGLSETQQASRKELALWSNTRFELKDWIADKVVWAREFNGPVPRYTFHSYSGRLMLYWPLNSEHGKARVKEDASLQARADAMGIKIGDIMVEVIDAYKGKTISNVFVESGNGSFGIRSGQSERDWLALFDTEGRVLVYSLSTSEIKHRFFGEDMALNPSKDLILVESFSGDITVYDLATGNRITDLNLDSGISFAQFSLAGDRLLLLSEHQTAYAFDVNRMIDPQKPK